MFNDFIDLVPRVYFLLPSPLPPASSPPTHKTLDLRLPERRSHCYAASVRVPPRIATNPQHHHHQPPIAIILMSDHSLDPNLHHHHTLLRYWATAATCGGVTMSHFTQTATFVLHLWQSQPPCSIVIHNDRCTCFIVVATVLLSLETGGVE